MTEYVYRERGGDAEITREFPMGRAPQLVHEGRRVFERAWCAPRLIVSGERRHGKPIDYLSDHLSVDLHGKYHKGAVVDTSYGPRLHFGSRGEEEHLRRAWNDSPESESYGKLRQVGECDEWRDSVKAHREEHG